MKKNLTLNGVAVIKSKVSSKYEIAEIKVNNMTLNETLRKMEEQRNLPVNTLKCVYFVKEEDLNSQHKNFMSFLDAI